ncbi:MAG: phage tail protein [Clostridia bacterium]|nr:phage tail protein [Clostridia bacterium]
MNKAYESTSLLQLLPDVLMADESVRALAVATADENAKNFVNTKNLQVFTRITELEQPLLDILASDFKVDWYLPDADVRAKRALIKLCFFVHKTLGTKAAMLRALTGLCPGTELKEWFEYDGLPGHFKVLFDITNQTTPVNYATLKHLIEIFKPKRSILDESYAVYNLQMLNLGSTILSCTKEITLICERS